MPQRLPNRIRDRIERHVDGLLRGLDLPRERVDEARVDFVEHLEFETAARIARGADPEEALEAALERFGRAREVRARLASWASAVPPRAGHAPRHATAADNGDGGVLDAVMAFAGDLRRDALFALRGFAREPGFAATVALTIALGVTATTTMFSIVDGVLIRGLGYPDPDRLVAVWPTFWFSNSNFSLLERDLLESGSETFAAIAGYSPRSVHHRTDEGTRSIPALRTTARFLDVLGPVMTAGRTFDADANQPGKDKVVVVAHGFWEQELGGNPAVVGRTIHLDGSEHTVLGVLAPGYDLIAHDAQMVLPKLFDPEHVRYRSAEMKALARLAPGATIQQADAELQAILAGWKERFDVDEDFGADFAVVPFRDFIVGDVRSTLILLFCSVTLILLIASANVVNLLLTRGIGRRREIAVRLALGARPGRVARQLLTESTLLALLGGAAGLAGSVFAVKGVVALLPEGTPRLEAIQIDARVAAFALTVALLTGWAVSIAPALRLGRMKLGGGLAAGGRGSTGRDLGRRLLVAAEIAMAVMLLIGSGLLIKSFWHLSQTDPGIRAEGLVTFYVGAERGRLQSFADARAFHALVHEHIAALPGVEGVSTISQAPYNLDGGVVGCRAYDADDPEADNENRCRWRTVGGGYFELTETRLLEGRVFGPGDAEGAEPVAVISAAAARQLFPGGALGALIATGFEGAVPEGLPWARVVGVVADVRFLGLAAESPLLVYRPSDQVGAIMEEFGFYGDEYVVRARAGAASLEAVRRAVRDADTAGLVAGYRPMRELIASSVSDRRAVLILMSAFAAAAFLLGTIGIYGITAHGVRSRSRELSIRIALGASAARVSSQVLAGGALVALGGATAGLLVALGLARFIDSFLYEVESNDPWVVASAVALALAVSVTATWLPALRAASADPRKALAAE